MNLKLIFTLLASMLILYYGFAINKVYSEKSRLQLIENNGVVSLRETWFSLQPELEKWNSSFNSDAKIRDLNGIYGAINIESHGLRSESLMLNDAGRNSVTFNGSSLGLTRVCITNSSQGFVLRNELLSNYTDRLQSLLLRNDIEYSKLTLRVDPEKSFTMPYVIFDKLCVLLRGSDTFITESSNEV